jgi:hypothetical protein
VKPIPDLLRSPAVQSQRPVAGYSATPLIRKLGIRDGCTVCVVNPPDNYRALLGPLPPAVRLSSKLQTSTNLIHIFTTRRAELCRALAAYRRKLDPAATVWVSWPKKAARVATDVTEDTVREVCLPLGFVDVKVCAIDETWSGLKLVVRRELRGPGGGGRR